MSCDLETCLVTTGHGLTTRGKHSHRKTKLACLNVTRLKSRPLHSFDVRYGCSEEDKQLIIHDFTNIRRFMYFYFQLKFGFWQQLPWLLFGIGHWNINLARSVARKLLRMRPKADALRGDHYLVILLLVLPVGRSALAAFARGDDMTSWLKRMAARFRFTNVVQTDCIKGVRCTHTYRPCCL